MKISLSNLSFARRFDMGSEPDLPSPVASSLVLRGLSMPILIRRDSDSNSLIPTLGRLLQALIVKCSRHTSSNVAISTDPSTVLPSLASMEASVLDLMDIVGWILCGF